MRKKATSVIHLANVQRKVPVLRQSKRSENDRRDLSELFQHQRQQDEAEIARPKEQSRLLMEILEKIELENEELKSRRFCLENIEGNSTSFYAGLPNMEIFQATLTLNPGKHCENIRYCPSSDSRAEKKS